MNNNPSEFSRSPSLWQRLALFAVLGCLPSCDPYDPEDYLNIVDNTEEEKKASIQVMTKKIKRERKKFTPNGKKRGSIPLCSQMKGLKVSDSPPRLHGKKKDSQIICLNDGDTFVSSINGKAYSIRPWGHDCPETSRNKKCMKKGKKACDREIKEGKRVRQTVRGILGSGKITLEPPYENNGSRLLAYVRLENGVDLGRTLVKKCLCKEGYTHKRKKSYQRAARGCR